MNDKGFTLIEVIVAVAILAVIAAMFSSVLASYSKMSGDISVSRSHRESAVGELDIKIHEPAVVADTSYTKSKINVVLEMPSGTDKKIECFEFKKNYGTNEDPSYISIFRKK